MSLLFSLRPATEEDLPQIMKIENLVHVSPWTENHFRSELEKPYSLFLLLTDDETDSHLAGYIVAWMMFDECQILNLAVDIPSRGLGLAKEMLRKVIFFASQKGIKRVVLEVRKSNLPAIQLYQGLRFVITHIRKGFYTNGEDAYSMALSLEEDPISF